MTVAQTTEKLTFQQRMDMLRATKLAHTQEKQEIIGAMDYDDWGLILPPEESREMTKSVSGSGVEVTEVRIKDVDIKTNHPSGGFFGPRIVGENYGRLLKAHPPYVDPVSSMAGGYMVNYYAYIDVGWNPDLDYSDLKRELDIYNLGGGIGAKQHFCQDLQIGLDLGFGGLYDKISRYRQENPDSSAFYDGLEAVVVGMQDWIQRTANEARTLAANEQDPQLAHNLLEMADVNDRLVTDAPRTFREAVQWIVWYQMAARMFNGSGSLGRLDVLLTPFYERDMAAGILTDEEAIFHVASYLVLETGYIQLGGPDETGADVTNEVSYLILEAAKRLGVPNNIGVCVGDSVDPGLLERGVEIQFEERAGTPKFLGVENLATGYTKNGYPIELARQRAYSGCHWFALPGREYTLNDCVKINLGLVFEIALKDMLSLQDVALSTQMLWRLFADHLHRAVDINARGLDFQIENMHKVFPELVLDLCCHGPVEKGLDASHYGVEYNNLCVDGAALATVADSFAACEQRIDHERRITWAQLAECLESNWAGPEGERTRLMMKSIPIYGSGGSRADDYAVMIAKEFTRLVTEKPTPDGHNMLPGFFSWANTIGFGEEIGATPNGRRSGEPISHGANPNPGFRQDGAPSAMAVAIASVQPGFGNSAPMQIELDPGISKDEGGLEKIATLIKTHVDLGGTQINMNVMDAAKVLEAHKDPSKHPDLIVRVTGFSAYFASLSPAFRQLVVDRIIDES